jgi:hypothetical protein
MHFNWGIFWAILAAFAVRGIVRLLWRPIAEHDRETRERKPAQLRPVKAMCYFQLTPGGAASAKIGASYALGHGIGFIL